MKAVYLKQIGGPKSLALGKIPRPQPKAGEVLVKIHATAITPTEFQWSPTFHTPTGELRQFPVVLSHEFSGVVESLGAGVENFKVGDAVFGLNDWFTNGAQADFCVAPATALARKPRLLDHVQSAVVPISALTAWQGLLEKAGLQSGQRRNLKPADRAALVQDAPQAPGWIADIFHRLATGGDLKSELTYISNETINSIK